MSKSSSLMHFRTHIAHTHNHRELAPVGCVLAVQENFQAVDLAAVDAETLSRTVANSSWIGGTASPRSSIYPPVTPIDYSCFENIFPTPHNRSRPRGLSIKKGEEEAAFLQFKLICQCLQRENPDANWGMQQAWFALLLLSSIRYFIINAGPNTSTFIIAADTATQSTPAAFFGMF